MDEQVGVEEQISKELIPINDLNNEYVDKLVNMVVEFMISKNAAAFQKSLETFAGYGVLAPSTLKLASRAFMILFEGGMKDGWSATQLYDKCTHVNIDSDKCEVIKSVWQKHSSHMASTLLAKTIAANELIDVDWSFGVTASSSDCDQIGKTYLQMKLTVKNDDEGCGMKDIFMELSLDQFYAFLSQMEKCKAYFDILNNRHREDEEDMELEPDHTSVGV